MIWPFKHRRTAPTHERATYDTDDGFPPLPHSIPLNNTPYEDIIIEFLEEARRKAEALEPGTSFTVTLPEDKRDAFVHPMEFLGPVMVRAEAYGLETGGCYNWEQTFMKASSPS